MIKWSGWISLEPATDWPLQHDMIRMMMAMGVGFSMFELCERVCTAAAEVAGFRLDCHDTLFSCKKHMHVYMHA